MFGKFVREFTPLEQLQHDLRQVKKNQDSSQIQSAQDVLSKSKYFVFLKSQVDSFTVRKKEEKIARGFFGTFTSTIWEVDLYITVEKKELHLGTVSFTDFEDKSFDKDELSDWLWGGFTVSFSTEIVRKMVEEQKSFKELLIASKKKIDAFLEQHTSATEVINSCDADKKQYPEYRAVLALLKGILENPKNSDFLSFDVDKLLGGKKKDGKAFLLPFLTIGGTVLIFAGVITIAIISPSGISEWAGLGPALIFTGVMSIITRLCCIGSVSRNTRTGDAQAVQKLLEKAEDLRQEDVEMLQMMHATKSEVAPQIMTASPSGGAEEKTLNSQDGESINVIGTLPEPPKTSFEFTPPLQPNVSKSEPRSKFDAWTSPTVQCFNPQSQRQYR